MLPGATQKDSDLIPGIMRQLWVFLGYVAAARLAILLALPPGYASPIWPAAGLAMAAIIVWGPSLTIAVFLGSIATNLRPDELMQNPMDQVLMQLGIALGSTLQAYLGSLIFHALERRCPNPVSPKRLSLEILLMGPVTCITAATVAISVLTAFHAVEDPMILSNWIFWWLGDSFGAGVISPILLRLLRNFHPRQIRRNVAPYLLVPAGLSLLLIGALIIHLKNSDRRNHQTLEQAVTDFHETVQQNATLTQKNLQILAEYSRIWEPKIVMEHYANRDNDGAQILWVPRISHEMRAEFENALGNVRQPFTILEKTASGHVAAAASRPVYWPIAIRTPDELNPLPSGFDLGSLPEVKDILQNAWNGSETLSSPPLTLGHNKKAIILVQKGFSPEGPGFQQGFFVAFITFDQLLKPALTKLDQAIFQIQIHRPGQDQAYDTWFGISTTESQYLRSYGQFQKPLVLGHQTLTLQVGFPAAAFHGGRLGDTIFMTILCMVLAFVLNVLVISQQNIPTVVNPEITAQQDELHRQYEALRDADRSKAQLLTNMSHQIKSPLQGILGLLDMLRGSNLDTRQRSSVDTIIANCHSMRLMLDDIQTYASMETEQLSLSTDDFFMEDCLRDLVSVYEIAAEESHNELKSKIDLPSMLRVQGDRRHIHRVLSHLLSDAIRRTSKGRIGLHVSLQNHQRLLLTVESQGGSQDEAHDNEWEFGNVKTWQSEIFNLKICERIVKAMDGEFILERPSPRVSRVTLILPLPLTLPQEQRGPGMNIENQDVLVVDDNAINLTVASGLLTKLGYKVETAANGREALDKVKEKRYGIIFMDCQMPVMDGYEAAQHIRTFYKPERGPWMIALTANAFEGSREKALQSGMDRWIVKPISLDTLIQTVGYAKKDMTAPSSQTSPLMDFKAFSMGLGNDSDLIQTAVLRYFEEIDGIMARLRDDIERGDAPSVGKTAHTLKGMTSLFAAHALVEAQRNLELAGKEGRIQEFTPLLKRIENLTELLKMELRKLIDDKSPTTKDVA